MERSEPKFRLSGEWAW